MYRRIPALAVAALVFALFACTASSPSPPPASLPPLPYTCPPTPGSQFTTPYPCTSAEHSVNSKRLERDALEAEATAIFKRFDAEYSRLVWAGGSDTLTPDLEATLAEPMKSQILSELADQKHAGETVRGPQPRLSLRADWTRQREGSIVTLETCNDLRGASIYDKNGNKISDGEVAIGNRYFKRFDGTLQMFVSTVRMEDRCPF